MMLTWTDAAQRPAEEDALAAIKWGRLCHIRII